jgi:hypothetical protein
MYKDKDKQKEANREANKRYRDKQKGITQGITLPRDVEETIERLSDTPEERAARRAIASRYQMLYPSPFSRGIAVRELKKPDGALHRVSRPGDSDYVPCGVPEACCECDRPLPSLEQPRQSRGMCLDCVVKGAA